MKRNPEPRLQLSEIPAKAPQRTWHPMHFTQPLDTRHWSGKAAARFEWQRTQPWLCRRHFN